MFIVGIDTQREINRKMKMFSTLCRLQVRRLQRKMIPFGLFTSKFQADREPPGASGDTRDRQRPFMMAEQLLQRGRPLCNE